MTKQEKLNDLFERWQAKQKNEIEYGNSDIDIDSFSLDGAISPDDYYKIENRFLFISKESHLKSGRKISGDYWLQNVYTKTPDYPETNFSKGIALLANALHYNDFETPNKNHKILKYVSFLNLNKRGGRKRCNTTVLKTYISNYKEEIAEEIELLEPTVIICAGKWLKYYVEKIIQPKGQYKIIEVYHPSYHYKSDIEHLKKLKEELNK